MEPLALHRGQPRLDVPVAAELLPADLHVGAHHQVGAIGRLPGACIRSRQRHLSASPPSIAASLEPVVELPVACRARASSTCSDDDVHAARSISAVCGYSSLSIMFLSAVSAISAAARGGIQVLTNVANLPEYWGPGRQCPHPHLQIHID